MTESSKLRIDEIKTYAMLRNLYFKSARPTSDFDAELFHKLCKKYEGIDTLMVVLDAFDKALEKIKNLEMNYEGALSDISEMKEHIKLLEEVRAIFETALIRLKVRIIEPAKPHADDIQASKTIIEEALESARQKLSSEESKK